MKIIASGVSNKGLVREKNEDNLFFFDQILDEDHEGTEELLHFSADTEEKALLCGVFDGMGGYSKGEHASYIMGKMAADCAMICQENPEEIPDLLEQLCFQANKAICQEMEETHEKMGTTTSMLCFHLDDVVVCNVGDTPIFRMRQDEFEPIFEEHSQRAIYEKMLGKEFVGNRKFPLTQCIGIPEKELRIRPYVYMEELMPGDRYLICSDGLTDMVSEERIQELIGSELTQDQVLTDLVEEACEAGGRDNITILLIEVLP